jgi:hypothetical protein
MILMNAFRQLLVPDPAAAEFVSITPLVEEDITLTEPESDNVRLSCWNGLHFRQVEEAPLDVRYSKVGNLA